MAADMMDSHQGNARGQAEGLGCGHSHQKRPHQTRTVGDGYGRKVFQSRPRLIQRFLNDLVDLLDMFPGCNLRHHTTVTGVQRNLAVNNI